MTKTPKNNPAPKPAAKTAIHRFIIALKSAKAPAAENADAGPIEMTATLMLPPLAIIRAIGISSEGIALFAQVDPAQEATEPRNFRMVRTGEQMAAGAGIYVGSLTPPARPALHLFELI